jgi:hypothetical protein
MLRECLVIRRICGEQIPPILQSSPPKGVPPTSLERLPRAARAGKPSAIVVLQEPRRTATVAALFHMLEMEAQDDAAELAEALITNLDNGAKAADKNARRGSLRNMAKLVCHVNGLAAPVGDRNFIPVSLWCFLILLQGLTLTASQLLEGISSSQAATSNSVAMNRAWALMSRPSMF